MANTILHLSDIQYGRHHVDGKNTREPLYRDSDYSPQLDKLIADLKILEGKGVRPDCIVVTGDIAEWSKKKEYEEAERFLGGIADYLGIDRRFVVMVPGNHDVNRNICKSARLNAAEEDEPFHPPYFEKFRYYKAFFDRFYESASFPDSIRPYRFSRESLFVNFYFPENRIAFVGLNSCIDESELEPHYGNIGVDQLKRACDELNRFDPSGKLLRVAVMHHNFVRSSDEGQENLKDADDLKPLLLDQGFSLILHGHQHQARQEVSGSGDRVIHVLATGSAGLDGEAIPEMARRYQIIQIEEPRVRVYRRCFDNFLTHVTGKGCWKADMTPEQTGIFDSFTLTGAPRGEVAETAPEAGFAGAPLTIPTPYRNWVSRQCEKMDIDRLREKGRVIQVSLPELFVPLVALPPGREKSEYRDEMRMAERERAEDIEDLICKNPYLLVEGQAGSGKTTLLKHFCHAALAEPTDGDAVPLFPVLMFLKDLKTFEEELLKMPSNRDAFARLFDRYGLDFDTGVTAERVKAFCEAGKAVFLLDGLDEIDLALRNWVAEALACFRDNHGSPPVVLSGRPHGIEGRVVDLFGDRHIQIQPLDMGQVETFVRKWFCHVLDQEEAVCLKTADDLLADMKDHPAVDELKDTPLMLTAICMLYNDGKELPGQRAELYNKFVNFLLYRRFPEPERIQRFLMDLALDMHTKRVRVIDQKPAVDILERIWTPKGGAADPDDRDRLRNAFETIESQCGLLKYEAGRYGFWHLTFQEFLAAAALVNRERRNYAEAIKDLWEDDWYREVVQLYIGHLSLNNSGMANEIVSQIMEGGDSAPFNRWRLAARALHDIHRDWREDAVVEKTIGRLMAVIGSDAEPKARADAGDILGRLGDPRDLKRFVAVEGGRYKLSTGEVDIQPFEIGKYPVTNAWYKAFIDAGGYQDAGLWTPEGRKWLEYTETSVPEFWYDRKWNCPNAAVVGVCWWEAMAFIAWLNASQKKHRYFLPDENQWEAAAAGKEGREYPWGEWEENRCNSEESKIEKTSAVGTFENGNTPEGVSDLAGNVWEWTRTEYFGEKVVDDLPFDEEVQQLYDGEKYREAFEKYRDKYEKNPVLRGGSWGAGRGFARCAFRFGGYPSYRHNVAGFRCART
jgi:formylglycine-generating enzyme required for sulfatase activity/3',5'-cyclic AMP phosphodiesterase CpdA